MQKEIVINGMMCQRCRARAEKALNAVDGVECTVDLDKKTAYVTLNKDVSDEALTAAVTGAGYEVVSIK